MARPFSPLVSVICPTYNRSDAIVRTIASVRNQSVTDWELLVMSDGCTDDTEDWVRAAASEDGRIRLVRTARYGHPSGPRNEGLAQARGEYTAYIDHDDVWRENHLDVVLSLFEEGGEIVATGFRCRNRQGEVTSSSDAFGLCWHPELQLLGPIFEPSRVAHHSGLAERVGGWRAGYGLEDWDLWLRLADAGALFTTAQDRTTELFDDPGTRRFATPLRHRMPVAAFDDPRRAHAVMTELRDERHEAAFRAAAEADTRAWIARLRTTDQFTMPRGWDGDLDAAITKAATQAPPPWPDLVLVPDSGRYLVAQRLWCSTAEHAERITELTRRTQREQFALVEAIVRTSGGTAAVPSGSGAR
ncbi:glycosyltransferase [Streptomyces sp. NPDC039022]|uniref:glycosyltransferase family 2 protein n=1 Tax=unclassified Streptomyces TaxID=2593676 RepID=UPI0034024D75